MPEYMDYNQHHEEKKITKGKKIRSWIIMGFSAAWLIVLAVWAFTASPDNIRIRFAAKTGNFQRFNNLSDETNEFAEFYTYLNSENSPEEVKMDSVFEEQYPEVYKLLVRSAHLYEREPYAYDGGNCLAVVLPYAMQSAGNYKGVDVLLIPYSGGVSFSEESEKTAYTLKISELIRYRIKYDYTKLQTDAPENRIITRENLDPKRFKLNFYKLTLNIEAADVIYDAFYKAQCTAPISNKESESISKNIKIKGNEKTAGKTLSGGEDETAGIIAKSYSEDVFALGENKITSYSLVIDFNDIMYDKFQSIILETIVKNANKTDNSGFSITVN